MLQLWGSTRRCEVQVLDTASANTAFQAVFFVSLFKDVLHKPPERLQMLALTRLLPPRLLAHRHFQNA